MTTPIGKVPPNRFVLISVALVLLTFALFWPVRSYDFIGYDDPAYITQNPHVQAGLTKESVAWAFGNVASEATYWHPLSWMSHMLDCQLFGLNPSAHHLVSVGFHALNAVLLFLVVHAFTGSFWRSAAIAGLFAWHPLQVESVAWVTERKNLLSTAFLLLTLLAYRRYTRKTIDVPNPVSGLKSGSYWFVFVVFALGLMSKPMIVTLPCVLLLLDVWPLRRFNFQSPQRAGTAALLVAEKVPLFILSAVSSWITIRAHQHLDIVVTANQVPLDIRIANAALSYVSYLQKLFWPNDLALIYPYPTVWPVSQFILTSLILLVVTALFIFLRKQRPYLLFGWLWFLGTMVPVIGILQVGSQPMADRFAYVPAIGILFATVWAAADLIKKLRPVSAISLSTFAVVAVACFVVGRHQLQFWQNSFTVFERAIAVTPRNAVAHYNLGLAYSYKGDVAKAKSHYRTALEISPTYVDAHNNLAGTLLAEGAVDLALAEYEKLLKTAPNHPLANYNVALAYEKKGNLAAAARAYEKAVTADPTNLQAYQSYINALGRSGNVPEATRQLSVLLEKNSKSPQAHLVVGNILMEQSSLPDAIRVLEKAVALSPELPEAHYQLGAAKAMSGRVSEAVPHFSQAARLKPDFAEAHFSLGMAFSQGGRTEEAVRKFRETLQIRQDFVPALLQLGLIWAGHENRMLRNGTEALKVAQMAAQITQNTDPAVLEVLAMAYAETQKWRDAIDTSKRALTLAQAAGDKNLVDQIQAKLDGYQKQLPPN